jgi:dTDP-4-dehydrorhamnose 3,5-epimerase
VKYLEKEFGKIEKTDIPGLEWRSNYVIQSGPRSYYVIENEGGGVTDVIYYPKEVKSEWYGLHIGQVDRLTFFGSPNTKIHGYFIDCRKKSEKADHKKYEMDFNPDPTRHLFIERGIAHTFDGLENVTVRVESIWYMSQDNPDYELANDTLVFRIDEEESKYPSVTINELPIPDEVLQYVLNRQQNGVKEGTITNKLITRTSLNGEQKRIVLTPKDSAD